MKNNSTLRFTMQTVILPCLFVLSFVFAFVGNGWGQVSNYAFSTTTETYSNLTGTTSTATGDDGTQTNISIGFTFNYGGADYTKFGISTNGIIRLGSDVSTTTFSSAHTNNLSTSNVNKPLIAVLWDDNNLNTGAIIYSTSGSAPNRVLNVNWKNTKIGSTGSTSSTAVSMLLRLYETSNVIEMVYESPFTTANTVTASVGLLDNSTFLSVTPGSTATVSSTIANNSINSTVMSNLAGKKLVYTPPTPCSGTPTAGTISTANQYLCSGATPANIVNAGFTSGVTGITLQWQQSSDDATWTNAVGGSGATTATYTPPAFAGTTIYYRCNVTCTNGGGAAATPSVSINPPANPATQVTNAVASSISYTGFTTTWVNGNGNRRVVYLSNAAIVDPSNGTGAAAHTVNTVYAGSGQQIVYDGTGTSVAVTGLTIGTTYYVKVFEYTRCGTTPSFDYYYNTTSATNAISVATSSPSGTPWSEGFAVGGTLTNWLSSVDFYLGTVTALNPALSSNYVFVNLYEYATTANITTPVIGSIPSNCFFVVKYKLADYDSPYAPPASASGNFIVAVSTDNGTNFTDVTTIANNAVAGWQEYSLNLSAYTGQNIRIRLTGQWTSGDYYLAFDDFTVAAANTAAAASSTPTLCISTALTNITHATTGATGIGSASGLPAGVTAAWASNTITISGTPSASGTFNYTIPLSGGYGSVNATGTITVNPCLSTWTGGTSTDWNTAANWNPSGVPTDNVIIPTTGITNFPVATSLTIDAGKTVTLNANSNLTVNGTLTNNGTLTLESGATLVQGTENTVAGSGTFNVKQALTGAGGATPSGRFWYLGSPVSGATSTALNAAGDNRLWSFSEATQSYTEITTNGVSMSPMQGHVVRLGASETSVFTGGTLNTGNYTNASLTNTGTTAATRGYHLLSNPYPSYLDWSAAYTTGATGISSTIWYRSYNTTNSGTMVFDTYNATGSVAATNSSGTTTQYIPPMQAFWVYNPTDNTTGSITFSNSMRSHQANGGLKDIEDFPAFARLNLVDGDFIDQVVVFTEPNAKNKVDNYDSKKFLLPNKPQVYATVGDEQLVINGLKSGMAKTIVPLTVELPNTQVYTFEMNESYVENGSVILEDTQEGVFQDMGIHTTYQFSGDAGVTANRFVLHFLLPTGNTSDSEDSQVGINDLTNAQIDVINNQQGSILVSISSDLQASGEIQILDAAGSLIQSKTISDHTTALAIKQGAGIYFVRVITPLKSEMKKIFIY